MGNVENSKRNAFTVNAKWFFKNKIYVFYGV